MTTKTKPTIDLAPQADLPPVIAELHCLCGAEWGWANRQWELRESPQQADRQRVPDGWKLVQAALRFYADASDYKAPFTGGMGKLWFDCGTVARSALDRIDAMLDAAPEAPAQASAVDERAVFEAWVADYALRHEPNYSKATEDDCWAAWQARAALAQKGGK